MKAKVKIFCILIGLLFSTNIFCQVDAFTIIDKWENGSTKTAYKIVGRDSISHEYFSNGKMRACGKNIRGTASSSGTFSLYYDNGQLYYQMFHDTTIARPEDSVRFKFPTLLYRDFYETGELQTLQYYHNGEVIKRTKFYKSGRIQQLHSDDMNGNAISEIAFYDNGFIANEYSMFKDTVMYKDRIEGNSIKTSSRRYPSYVVHWYDNGVVEYKGDLMLDEHIGRWLYYDRDGHITKEENYD